MSETHCTNPEFRPIDEFDGYFAGSDGSIWSLKPRGPGKREKKPLRLKPDIVKGTGYCRVNLFRGRTAFKRYVHRLVLRAFVGDPPEGFECGHVNGTRTDNRLENLKWCSKAENAADRERHGNTLRGERHGRSRRSRLTDEKILEIRRMSADGVPQRAIANRMGISYSMVWFIIHRKAWRHV